MAKTPALLWLTVEDVVRTSMAEVGAGTVVIIPGWQYKALTTASRLAPRTLVRALTNKLGKGRGRT